jgi:non-homologous end joining protein Ku
MRSMWAGAISFGLVNIPVKLYAATEQRDVAKAYELPGGELVVLDDEGFRPAAAGEHAHPGLRPFP